jgi:hypothetical protein
MPLLQHKKSSTDEGAAQAARTAAEAGMPVLVMRFNEKLVGDSSTSGSVVNALSTGIAAVEATGLYRFDSIGGVEKDSRTMGDRMAFYAVFRLI